MLTEPRQSSPAETFFIRPDYHARTTPVYFSDDPEQRVGLVWQPDVYVAAARVAQECGARRLVDIGCGDGQKLMQFRTSFDLFGIDFGDNIAACRSRYDSGTWIEHDLDSEGALPIPRDDGRRTVLICSDVIEHVVHPDRLLLGLRQALDAEACALVISTPERELSRGSHHLGPPQNPAHVREWTLEEFGAFLAWAGFQRGRLGLTRSNNHNRGRHTILGTLRPNAGGGTLHVDVGQKRLAMLRRRMVTTIRALPLLH
jgi:SAM-dependent methyltransferase